MLQRRGLACPVDRSAIVTCSQCTVGGFPAKHMLRWVIILGPKALLRRGPAGEACSTRNMVVERISSVGSSRRGRGKFSQAPEWEGCRLIGSFGAWKGLKGRYSKARAAEVVG